MKVQELRNLIAHAERGNVEKAFVECYKQLRKAQKEEIDAVICSILEGKEAEAKKADEPENFEELSRQIYDFMCNAYAGNYFAPNRLIPKSQRPKWRFMVKNFIKELSKIPVDNENYVKAVKQLTDLYKLICAACYTYLFSTEDPFRSIGWKQADFFALVVLKTFADGYSREKITLLLPLAVSGGLSMESLHIEQGFVLLNALKTSDVKYMAIEEAKSIIKEKEGKLAGLKKYDSRYELEDMINELCSLIFLITIELGEAEDGITYFFEHEKDWDEEITLYRALELVDFMEDDRLWLEVYKYGLTRKIRPRDRLQEEYEQRRKKEGTEHGKTDQR